MSKLQRITSLEPWMKELEISLKKNNVSDTRFLKDYSGSKILIATSVQRRVTDRAFNISDFYCEIVCDVSLKVASIILIFNVRGNYTSWLVEGLKKALPDWKFSFYPEDELLSFRGVGAYSKLKRK